MKNHAIVILLVFIGTGIWTMCSIDFQADKLVTWFLYGLVWFSGAYYFYLNAATEDIWDKVIGEPVWRKHFDSFLIILQGVGFEGLWFAIHEKYLNLYAIDILILNISYLAWDLVYNDLIKKIRVASS